MDQPKWTDVTSAISSLVYTFLSAIALVFAIWAARASGKQARLLEKQVELLEPRAILLLSYTSDGFEVENVGHDLAFDVGLSPIEYTFPLQSQKSLRFQPESIVRFGVGPKRLSYDLEPRPERRFYSGGQQVSELNEFLDRLAAITTANAMNRGEDPQQRLVMTTITGQHRNAHNQIFPMSFDLMVADGRTYECRPSNSLLEQRVSKAAT